MPGRSSQGQDRDATKEHRHRAGRRSVPRSLGGMLWVALILGVVVAVAWLLPGTSW